MHRIAISILALAAGIAAPAHGQGTSGQTDTTAGPSSNAASGSSQELAQSGYDGISDIVVTARRVAERLQDVPVAVTALTGEGLREKRVMQIADLRTVTPGLQITPSVNGSSLPGVTIRGQRAARSLIGQDPAVVFYVNEVPNSRPAGINTSVYDLATVQVLKGPQGTLFGRNTTGGAILIESKRPVFDFEGYVQGTLGNFDDREIEGAVNIPLSGTVALRAAGNILRRDGYARNGITGQRVYDVHSESGRLSLLIQPNDRFKSVFIGDIYHSDSNGNIQRSLGVFPGTLLTLDQTSQLVTPAGTVQASVDRQFASGTIRYVESEALTFEKTRSIGIANITTYELTDELTLKGVFGYRDVNSETATDFDGVAAQGIVSSSYTADASYGSGELQLAGKFDKLDFIVGVFGYGESGVDHSIAANFRRRGTDTENFSGGSARNRSYSAYAQGNWEFVPRLTLTLGARYTIDKRRGLPESSSTQTIPTVANLCSTFDPVTNLRNPYPNCGVPLKTSFKEPTYNVSLNYKPTDDWLLYVAHRRGYRSGGFNVRAVRAGEYVPFRPEIVRDLEFGSKLDFNIGSARGRLNVAVYKQWYDDIQRNITLFVNNLLTTNVFNAAKATIEGGEIEATLVPIPGLTLSGYYATTRPKYQEFIQQSATGPIDLSSNRFADVPRHQGSATIAYSVPVGKGRVTASGTIYAQSRFELADINRTIANPLMREVHVPGYHLFNARIEWQNAFDSGLDLAVFGQNLGDKEYFLSGTNTPSTGYTWAYVGPPRMYGVQVRWGF